MQHLKRIWRDGSTQWLQSMALFAWKKYNEPQRIGILLTPRYIEWLAKRDAAESAQ